MIKVNKKFVKKLGWNLRIKKEFHLLRLLINRFKLEGVS